MYNLSLHDPVVQVAVASRKVTVVQISAKISQAHIMLAES